MKMSGILKAAACMTAAAILSGCFGKGKTDTGSAPKLTISDCGSDTMVNLAQMWAEEYRKAKPNVSVEVSGGGSGVGIRDLAVGIVDIANASRDITQAEIAQARNNTGKEPKLWNVGADGIAIYAHKDNPIDTITLEQLAAIFGEGGTIDKWSQLGIDLTAAGGRDEIVRISRQNNSGTYAFFREHVLDKKDFKLGSRDMSGSKDVVELVARTPGAIGYSGMGYRIDTVKELKVAKKAGDPGVLPSIATVHDGSYPLSRALHMYTLGEPAGHVKEYIDWVLSPVGQKIVEDAGYVPNVPQ